MALLKESPFVLDGTAQAFPAPPEHARSLSIQPQGGDVHYRLDGSTTPPTLTSGRIWYEGGEYPVIGDWTLVRFIGVAGTVLDLVWRDE